MAMVSNKFLGALSVKLGFNKHLRINSPPHIHLIGEYVAEITEAEIDSNGARDYWTTTRNPPKVDYLNYAILGFTDLFNSVYRTSWSLISELSLSTLNSITKRSNASSRPTSAGSSKT